MASELYGVPAAVRDDVFGQSEIKDDQTQDAVSSIGEYLSPDPRNSTELWRARLDMIRAVKRVYPKFLERLSVSVFPLYSRLAGEGTLAKEGYDFEKALLSDNPRLTPYDILTEHGGLKSALAQWAAKFNAKVDWLITGALRTLHGWNIDPDWREQLTWDSLHTRDEAPVIGEVFDFRYQGWEVRHQTWLEYTKSVRQHLEDELSKYEKTTRELATSQGLILRRKKYSPDNLEWFVLYQFACMSSKEIADLCSLKGRTVDESTVLKGVKAAVELLGWEHLRPPRRSPNRKIR